jgi:hypothetical protein
MVDIKSALQSLHTGTCDIYQYGTSKDPVTKITGHQEVKVNATPIPCRLSIKTVTPSVEGSGAYSPKQVIKLFMDPDVVVKAGSKIVVTQNGRTTAYKNAGEPAVYSNHQEIMLELFERWA